MGIRLSQLPTKLKLKLSLAIWDHIQDILGGKYGEMPCNLHHIWGDGGNKRTKVAQLTEQVTDLVWRKKVPVIRLVGRPLKQALCII